MKLRVSDCGLRIGPTEFNPQSEIRNPKLFWSLVACVISVSCNPGDWFAASGGADRDPFDQSAAAAADPLGGDAVFDREPAAQSAVDIAQATAVALGADDGDRGAGADARTPGAA